MNQQQGDARQARLCVRDAEDLIEAFSERHQVHVECAPLNLERMFPLWLRAEKR